MGNKQARELSRPKDRGRSTVCDQFELSVTYRHPSLRIQLLTDLPLNTRIEIAASRLFEEADGHRWVWTMLDTTLPVTALEGNLKGFILERSYDHLDMNGVKTYRWLKRGMEVDIAKPPSPEVIVALGAPVGQHRFGLCNRRLLGAAVSISPSGHFIERGMRLSIPLSPTAMRQIGMPCDSPPDDELAAVGVAVTDPDQLTARTATLIQRRN